jgi:hypothetical protein
MYFARLVTPTTRGHPGCRGQQTDWVGCCWFATSAPAIRTGVANTVRWYSAIAVYRVLPNATQPGTSQIPVTTLR